MSATVKEPIAPVSSSARNTKGDASGGSPPSPSSNEDECDDDIIGALIYKESRTAKAWAEKEREASASAARFGPDVATGGAEAEETGTHHERESQGSVHRGKNRETQNTREREKKKWIPFEERLEELKAYKAKHGHTQVKQHEDRSLAKFCENVRGERRNPGKGLMKLPGERIAALDALGFNWTPRRQINVKSFEERLEKLKAYKAKHGHLKVTKGDDNSLYKFCADARFGRRFPSRCRNMRMTQERIASLDALGFNWTTREEKYFDERVRELEAYKAKHGHLNVKERDDKSLAKFCYEAKRAHRDQGRSTIKLTEERIASLDALGFEWTPRQRPMPKNTRSSRVR